MAFRIARGIVDDEQFPVRIDLGLDGPDAFGQEGAYVMGRHYNGHQGGTGNRVFF